jgi:hypothetical protein
MVQAPICPTSRSELKPLPRTVVDAIRQIPRATDLRSAIIALNRISNVLNILTRAAPQINNIVNPRQPSSSQPSPPQPENGNQPGTDYNPGYIPANWIEETRNYTTRRLINPDDTSQHIDIKVLTEVVFRNLNTDYRLYYED